MSKVKKVLTEDQINAIELVKRLEEAALFANEDTMNVESQAYSKFAELSDSNRLNTILERCGLPYIELDDLMLPDSSDFGRKFTDIDIEDGHYSYTTSPDDPEGPEGWETYVEWLYNSGAYDIYRAGVELIRQEALVYLRMIDNEYVEVI